MARGARLRCDALSPRLGSQPLPLGASQRPAPRTGPGAGRGSIARGGGPGPCQGCLLPRELGAGPGADATGRGPRWLRPRREGGVAGAAAPPPAGAARERWELRLLHWRGGRTTLPRSRPGAGAAAAGTQAGKRGRAEDSGRAGCAGARRCGLEVAPGWQAERRACAAVTQAPASAGPGVPDEALDAALEPPPGPRRRRTQNPGAGSGTWGRAAPRLGSAGADAGCEPRDASGPPALGKRRDRARQPGVLPRGPAGGAGACFALPVVGRPQQRRFLEIQITGCGRPPRVLRSRGGFPSHWGGTQQSVKEVSLDRVICLLSTYCVPT